MFSPHKDIFGAVAALLTAGSIHVRRRPGPAPGRTAVRPGGQAGIASVESVRQLNLDSASSGWR